MVGDIEAARQRHGFLRPLGMAGTIFAGNFASGQSAACDTIPLGTLGAAGRGPGRERIALLVHPDMVLQDLVGPLTVFNMMRAEIHLVWKTLDPVRSDVGIAVAPSTRYRDCAEPLDILFAPGGLAGTIAAMQDGETLEFLQHQGRTARYVTSDCTGSLLLGAAGLLRGYRAASHWSVRDQVALLGATPSAKRVEIDRNRITGGGVTAGIDFGLTLAAVLRGKDAAELISLILEYAPEPPFGGRPEQVNLQTHARAVEIRAAVVERAREQARIAGLRLERSSASH